MNKIWLVQFILIGILYICPQHNVQAIDHKNVQEKLPANAYLLNAIKAILFGNSNSTNPLDLEKAIFDFIKNNPESTLNELLIGATQQFLLVLKKFYDESYFEG